MGKTNIRSADLNLLAVFDALFDERSVTRAAGRLALTQPTVSGMLARLRHDFGDELFVRTSHGVLPTPRAEELAVPIKALLVDARALFEPAEFDPARETFTVRICGSDYLQRSVISPFAAAILKAAPQARISVIQRPASGLSERLASGDIDFSVAIRPIALTSLPIQPLFNDRYLCTVRDGHPLRPGRIAPEELCAFDHAFVDPTSGSFRGPMDAVLERVGMSRRVAVSVPTFAMLFDLLRSTNLVAFVPNRLAVAQAGLRTMEADLEIEPLEVVANWHPRVEREPRHIWLRETLAGVMARPPV